MGKTMMRMVSAWLAVFCLTVPAISQPVLAGTADESAPSADVWPGLAAEIFPGRAIMDDGTATLEAPVRADDAAVVPMTIRFAKPGLVDKATLLIDQNPMPLAGAFTIGEHAGVGFIETRVRVDSYTNVHVVTQTRDGTLHAVVRFVKASGGCSAPSGNSAGEAKATLGQIKYREFKSAAPGRREAQVMVRHPNHSGMQMDQVSHIYTPAHYIDRLEVRQGKALIFAVESGISLSQNPTFRFDYADNGAGTISVEAHDSEGGVFKGEWPVAQPQ
jgi:sulfur-oxidizing protein SoxY